MERVGEITAVRGRLLEVTLCRPEDCDHCHACDGGQKRTVVTVEGEGRVGDLAAVELPTGTVVKASLLAYALPIAGLIGGIGIGALVFPDTQAGAAVLGLAGLAVCLSVILFTEKKRRGNPAWQPVLTRVLPKELYAQKDQNEQKEGADKP